MWRSENNDEGAAFMHEALAASHDANQKTVFQEYRNRYGYVGSIPNSDMFPRWALPSSIHYRKKKKAQGWFEAKHWKTRMVSSSDNVRVNRDPIQAWHDEIRLKLARQSALVSLLLLLPNRRKK